jgi:hypothetical protein
MAKQTSLFLPRGFKSAGATVNNASGTNWVTVYTASADDSTVKALSCVSDDTAARNLRIAVDISGTVYQIATVNIPIAAGTNGTEPAVDLLGAAALTFLPCDRNGKRILTLAGGVILKVAALVTVTSGKTITVSAQAEEY